MSWRQFFILLPPVALIVFLSQTWPFWEGGKLLPGTDPDGPFHYFCELIRMSPSFYPEDIAVNTNRNHLGYYELSYAAVIGLVRMTGLSLLNANLILSWMASVAYIAGVMFLFSKLELPARLCALGTLLAVQPYSLIGPTGVEHALAIPRDMWAALVPWFFTWYLVGRPRKGYSILFYGALGLIYGFTYPLWAILLGLAFGSRDLLEIARNKSYRDLIWLGAGALVCLGLVAVPSLATVHVFGAEEGAVLDYNQRARVIYTSTGFRRLMLFAALGGAAIWLLKRSGVASGEPVRRLRQLWTIALVLCLVVEPLQRLIPTLSLLYLGRLSVFVYLGSMVFFVLSLRFAYRTLPGWGKTLKVLAAALILLDPQRSLARELTQQPLSLRRDFIRFCSLLKDQTSQNDLFVIPPIKDNHYFRLYAERGLWMSPKDLGILSRSRSLYTMALKRRATLEEFFGNSVSASEREKVLEQWKGDGVDYLVTKTDQAWARELSWPVVLNHEQWELRAAPK